jgi:plasmid stabilization system protein ParE
VKRLRLTPEAELDLDDAHFWYHRQAPQVAADFLGAINASLSAIRRRPEAYALIDATTRRALVRRFPYAVFYEITSAEILVYAVFHCARDPRAWRRRRDG